MICKTDACVSNFRQIFDVCTYFPLLFRQNTQETMKNAHERFYVSVTYLLAREESKGEIGPDVKLEKATRRLADEGK